MGKITIPKSGAKKLDGSEIRTLLGAFTVQKTWVFPNQRKGDGCIGMMCVSKSEYVTVKGAKQKLGIHATFYLRVFVPGKITIERENKKKVKKNTKEIELTLKLSDLHFTARPKGIGDFVADSGGGGGAMLYKDYTIHWGVRNDWVHKGKKDDFKKLPDALGMSNQALGLQNVTAKEQRKAYTDAIRDALDKHGATQLSFLGVKITEAIVTRMRNATLPKDYEDHKIKVKVEKQRWN
ncbi:MAG: hypothetical protein KZQ97_09670 [Candidatus Thiodiazotropha sp. (ex Dulcina madagascariensis)]|nr:hypothetical protein [Candidatus Thiodiazotropha sp. (ex Dulcina madagascariensis)]